MVDENSKKKSNNNNDTHARAHTDTHTHRHIHGHNADPVRKEMDIRSFMNHDDGNKHKPMACHYVCLGQNTRLTNERVTCEQIGAKHESGAPLSTRGARAHNSR